MKIILKEIKYILLSLIFPKKCFICEEDDAYLCQKCEMSLGKVDVNTNKISDWVFYKYKYQNPIIKKIEYTIKYNHHPKLAVSLGEYSYNFILENIINKNKEKEIKKIYLIPIPLSEKRLGERGYNQAEHIAKGISKASTTFEVLNILTKKNTSKLKDIRGIDNRLSEVFKTMSITNNFIFEKGDIFILIDDISTTGATFYEARRALIECGIIKENIYAYSLAH